MTIEDFRKPGTILPSIPSGTEYRCEQWSDVFKNDNLFDSKDNNISFGSRIYEWEEYILADTPNPYVKDNHYMFKISDIERLAKEQGMIKEEKYSSLPKSFACKNTDDKLWKKYIKWLNKTYHKDFIGNAEHKYIYYGITNTGGYVDNHTADRFDHIMSLGVWNEIVNGVKQNKKEDMNKTVKKSDLKKIHDVACSTWRDKISHLASRNTFGDTVELTQLEIDEMFKAADSTQTRVLEEVFGKQIKDIDLSQDTVDGKDLFKKIGTQTNTMITVRTAGVLRYKGFYLSSDYTWEIRMDDSGFNILVPTRK